MDSLGIDLSGAKLSPSHYSKGFGMVEFPDGNLLVTFEEREYFNDFATKAEGRPIYDTHDFITIAIPDGTIWCNRFDRLSPKMKAKYQAQYNEWKTTRQVTTGRGTPIEEMTQLPRGRVHELKALGIHTVDQLALLSDAQIQRIGMGGRELVEQAKLLMARAKDAAGDNEILAELKALRATVKSLQEKDLEPLIVGPDANPQPKVMKAKAKNKVKKEITLET